MTIRQCVCAHYIVPNILEEFCNWLASRVGLIRDFFILIFKGSDTSFQAILICPLFFRNQDNEVNNCNCVCFLFEILRPLEEKNIKDIFFQ